MFLKNFRLNKPVLVTIPCPAWIAPDSRDCGSKVKASEGQAERPRRKGWRQQDENESKIQNFSAWCHKQVPLPVTGIQRTTVLCFILHPFLESCQCGVFRPSLTERSSVTRAPWLRFKGDLNEYCHPGFTGFPQVPRNMGPRDSQEPTNPATPFLILLSQVLPLATYMVLWVDYISQLCLNCAPN